MMKYLQHKAFRTIFLNSFHRDISVSDLTVRCGEWDITNQNELHLHQDRVVSKVMIHPLYTGAKSVQYNFALLHLKEEFELDKHIAPICLPDIPDQKTGKVDTRHMINHYSLL